MTDHAKEGEGNAIKVVVVTNPDVLHQVLDAQKAGGMPNDRVAYNDGFSVGAGEGDARFAAKDAVQIGNVYAVAYRGLPDSGIGSKNDIHDSIAWYNEQPQYQMNRDFNRQVVNALQA